VSLNKGLSYLERGLVIWQIGLLCISAFCTYLHILYKGVLTKPVYVASNDRTISAL
jgi:hypothetical protein